MNPPPPPPCSYIYMCLIACNCFKDSLPDGHSCLNLYPCVIKVQSINQPTNQSISLSTNLSLSVCQSVCLIVSVCLSVCVSACLSIYVSLSLLDSAGATADAETPELLSRLLCYKFAVVQNLAYSCFAFSQIFCRSDLWACVLISFVLA